MELFLIGVLLAFIALFTNIRLVAVCVLLVMGGGWLYQQLPRDQQKYWHAYYTDITKRSRRAWHAFWR